MEVITIDDDDDDDDDIQIIATKKPSKRIRRKEYGGLVHSRGIRKTRGEEDWRKRRGERWRCGVVHSRGIRTTRGEDDWRKRRGGRWRCGVDEERVDLYSPLLAGPSLFKKKEGLVPEDARSLRPIVIDGSNVAMCHGNHISFSARGIEICIEYFRKRGHDQIVAFLPQYRLSKDPVLLMRLEKEGNLVFTPSRTLRDGERVVSYDDRFIVEYAHTHGGVIISRDNFKDLVKEKSEWKTTIEERLLMPTFVHGTLMFPQDPQGYRGISLDQLLKF